MRIRYLPSRGDATEENFTPPLSPAEWLSQEEEGRLRCKGLNGKYFQSLEKMAVRFPIIGKPTPVDISDKMGTDAGNSFNGTGPIHEEDAIPSQADKTQSTINPRDFGSPRRFVWPCANKSAWWKYPRAPANPEDPGFRFRFPEDASQNCAARYAA